MTGPDLPRKVATRTFLRNIHWKSAGKIVDRQAGVWMIRDNSRNRHRRNHGIVWSLDQDQADACPYCPQPGGTIAVRTAKDNADNPFSVCRSSGLEQWIRSRTCSVDSRSLAQQDAICIQEHMVVGWCDVDLPTPDRSVVLCERRG